MGLQTRRPQQPHRSVIECIRLAREKVFGNLKIIRAGFGFRIGDPTGGAVKRALAGGGALMDVGIYALQATRYLTGKESVMVSAFETKTDRLSSGKWTNYYLATQVSKWHRRRLQHFLHCQWHSIYYTAYAEKGWASGLTRPIITKAIKANAATGRKSSFPRFDQFAAEMDDFARCIRENKPSKVSGEEGLRDIRITSAIYESIQTRAAVRLAGYKRFLHDQKSRGRNPQSVLHAFPPVSSRNRTNLLHIKTKRPQASKEILRRAGQVFRIDFVSKRFNAVRVGNGQLSPPASARWR